VPWRDEAIKRGYSSVIGIPLADKEGKCGVITIYAAETDAFDDREVGLLQEMADDLVYGIMGLRARKQREIAERELRKTKDELESRVQERTRELSLANEVLEREVAERKQIEKNLRVSYEKLKSLTSELARVEENERKRIAADLHDRLGQNLAIAKLTLETLGGEIGAKFSMQLNSAIDLLKESIKDTRYLVKELSPQLFELGFTPAVVALCEQMKDKYGMEIKYKGAKNIKLPDEIQSFLFRAIRELIINSVKHSGTKKINVEVKKNPEFVSATIKDYGKGFETGALDESKGFGLFSIRERLEVLGGSFRIDSPPQKGALVNIQIPL
jgi:signal transduction histidine kinase